MPLSHRLTLTQFLIEERRRFPQAKGHLNALILDIALAAKAISRTFALGMLDTRFEAPERATRRSDVQKHMDTLTNDIFVQTNEWGGHLAGMGSEEMEDIYQIPKNYSRGSYLLLFDPLDGSSNIDVNVTVGSIFSILRTPSPHAPTATEQDFLQPGARQVAAGYVLYGPCTMLVLSVGNGVSAFTLDPALGEFMLTQSQLTIPPKTAEFAINTSNSRFWEPPIKRYVDECLLGRAGPREKDFNMRWVASMVADAHRILLRGGVYMYPRDTKEAGKAGRLRLLYEANPIGFLIEQAGGRASTGREPVLQVQPEGLHQCIGFVFGSKEEVERIERYHNEPYPNEGNAPLFTERGLFCD
jgi:fructose-1,6-bisphosphatase I/sedoheptulose-1,7-bisphosphatase